MCHGSKLAQLAEIHQEIKHFPLLVHTMWLAHAMNVDESREIFSFKSHSQYLSPLPNNLALYCLASPLCFHIHTQGLPTFVLDQHALQCSTSRDLAQPQFPVHLLSWSGQLPVPVSKERLWFSRSAVLTLNSCFKARLGLYRLRRWRLKRTSVHSAGKKRKKAKDRVLLL